MEYLKMKNGKVMAMIIDHPVSAEKEFMNYHDGWRPSKNYPFNDLLFCTHQGIFMQLNSFYVNKLLIYSCLSLQRLYF